MARRCNPERRVEKPRGTPVLEAEKTTPHLVALHAPGRREAAFPSGRRIVLDEDGAERVTVLAPDGEIELAVRFTETGPVLTFRSAAIRMETEGRIALACGKLDVRARHGIELSTAGDLVQQAEGHHTLRAGGASVTEAHAVQIRARRGEVRVKANDDVRVDGERILLNS